MKLLYPAYFYPCEEKEGYTVVVPDLPGCVSEGNSLADAILMGTDAASGWLLDELEEGRELPKATDIKNVHPEEGGIVSLLVIDMDSYAEKYGKASVRKNLTIPAYMNTYIEKNRLSLSQIAQDAIGAKMQLQ